MVMGLNGIIFKWDNKINGLNGIIFKTIQTISYSCEQLGRFNETNSLVVKHWINLMKNLRVIFILV